MDLIFSREHSVVQIFKCLAPTLLQVSASLAGFPRRRIEILGRQQAATDARFRGGRIRPKNAFESKSQKSYLVSRHDGCVLKRKN